MMSLLQTRIKRLLKRATSKYNDLLDDAYDNGDTDEKKRKRKIVAKNLNALKRVKKENKHVENVMAVTRNRAKLQGENAMSSQEVLDRMQIIFDNEDE